MGLESEINRWWCDCAAVRMVDDCDGAFEDERVDDGVGVGVTRVANGEPTKNGLY